MLSNLCLCGMCVCLRVGMYVHIIVNMCVCVSCLLISNISRGALLTVLSYACVGMCV